MTNLDSILKSRDIALQTKVCLFKAMVFPVVMYGCESWTGKKAEHRRIDAFELWRWRRLLRVPWTARRSNQSILKEISPGCSLDWCWSWNNALANSREELTQWKRPWCWEGLRARGGGDNRGWDGWMASMDMSLSKFQVWWWIGRPSMLGFMGSQRVGHNWVSKLNRTELILHKPNYVFVQKVEQKLVQASQSIMKLYNRGGYHIYILKTTHKTFVNEKLISCLFL